MLLHDARAQLRDLIKTPAFGEVWLQGNFFMRSPRSHRSESAYGHAVRKCTKAQAARRLGARTRGLRGCEARPTLERRSLSHLKQLPQLPQVWHPHPSTVLALKVLWPTRGPAGVLRRSLARNAVLSSTRNRHVMAATSSLIGAQLCTAEVPNFATAVIAHRPA